MTNIEPVAPRAKRDPLCPFLGRSPDSDGYVCLSEMEDLLPLKPLYVTSFCLKARHVTCRLFIQADSAARKAARARQAAAASSRRDAAETPRVPSQPPTKETLRRSASRAAQPVGRPERRPARGADKVKESPTHGTGRPSAPAPMFSAASTSAANAAEPSRVDTPAAGSIVSSPAGSGIRSGAEQLQSPTAEPFRPRIEHATPKAVAGKAEAVAPQPPPTTQTANIAGTERDVTVVNAEPVNTWSGNRPTLVTVQEAEPQPTEALTVQLTPVTRGSSRMEVESRIHPRIVEAIPVGSWQEMQRAPPATESQVEPLEAVWTEPVVEES